MIADLKIHSDTIADKIIVMDAGFASEENLEYLSKEQLKYVCVSRKQLKDYQLDNEENLHRTQDKRGGTIDLQVFTPEGYADTWMCVQSEQKRVKEQSMTDKLTDRFEEELLGLSNGLSKKRTTKQIGKVWERIGRMRQKHRLVSGRYNIEMISEGGKAQKITWKKTEKGTEKEKKHGMYFIRTNMEKVEEKQLWDVYNTIREVESTFRCLKNDLLLRPVYHQKDERIESHLYLAILAYQLVNTIRYMLKKNGINHEWKNIVRIMNTQTIQSILCNAETKTICIRKPSNPIREVQDIYKATNTNSMTPERKKYVVCH
jgi:transposase